MEEQPDVVLDAVLPFSDRHWSETDRAPRDRFGTQTVPKLQASDTLVQGRLRVPRAETIHDGHRPFIRAFSSDGFLAGLCRAFSIYEMKDRLDRMRRAAMLRDLVGQNPQKPKSHRW
jgi:hypothetical protein